MSFRVHSDHSKEKILLRHFCDCHRRTHRPHIWQNHFVGLQPNFMFLGVCSLLLSKVALLLVLMQLEWWLEALISSAIVPWLKFMHCWILCIHKSIDKQALERGPLSKMEFEEPWKCNQFPHRYPLDYSSPLNWHYC